MITVVTGSEQGLGAELMGSLPGDKVGMAGSVIRAGKQAIDKDIAHIIASHGKIDRFINNFGINHLSWIGTTPEADEEILRVNTLGPYWTINALVAQGQVCRVVNVASATYRVPQRCTSLYCASKAALVHMSKVMARELAPQGWVINAIAPGMMPETEMSRRTSAQVRQLRGWTEAQANDYAMGMIPMERPTSCIEVALAIRKIFELPDYINGEVIPMMGGV